MLNSFTDFQFQVGAHSWCGGGMLVVALLVALGAAQYPAWLVTSVYAGPQCGGEVVAQVARATLIPDCYALVGASPCRQTPANASDLLALPGAWQRQQCLNFLPRPALAYKFQVRHAGRSGSCCGCGFFFSFSSSLSSVSLLWRSSVRSTAFWERETAASFTRAMAGAAAASEWKAIQRFVHFGRRATRMQPLFGDTRTTIACRGKRRFSRSTWRR